MEASTLILVLAIIAGGAYALMFFGVLAFPAFLAFMDSNRCQVRKCTGVTGKDGNEHDGTCPDLASQFVLKERATCKEALDLVKKCPSCSNCKVSDFTACNSTPTPPPAPTKSSPP
jgi:hypothetical protein